MAQQNLSRKNSAARPSQAPRYGAIEAIDGRHALKDKIPSMAVEYQARLRPGGQLTWFNFDLAREMGLVDAEHPPEMTAELERAMLDTFGLIIINEWDQQNGRKFAPRTIKKNTYMATRYLQLQHPNKRGETSGDGRSIWNGEHIHRGKVWDVSSCGTGSTKLSPATAIHKRFFKSGDTGISYGCGMADFDDAVSAALMSEIFHKSGIPTERCLGILRYKDGTAIAIRAAHNLMRPAHFFRLLKLNQLDELRLLIDFYVDRQVGNGEWKLKSGQDRYDAFLDRVCRDFARSAALFESEYVFCWLDWDGDNILTNQAAILDYGSVRQFGLFHRNYRYDDVERWSTNILEQKGKAANIIQTFAQMIDYARTGVKRPLRDFAHSQLLRQFDRRFEESKRFFLMRKIGLSDDQARRALEKSPRLVSRFKGAYETLERQQSTKGIYKVHDGITSDAVFCMRDLLRELPKHLMAETKPIGADTFVQIARSSYAREEDLKMTAGRRLTLRELQDSYLGILRGVADSEKKPLNRCLLELTMRSSLINRHDRITGNAILRVTDSLLSKKEHLKDGKLARLMRDFILYQCAPAERRPPDSREVLRKLKLIVENSREEI